MMGNRVVIYPKHPLDTVCLWTTAGAVVAISKNNITIYGRSHVGVQIPSTLKY